MKVLVDAFTKEEVISDSFDLQPVYNGVAYEVKSKYIIVGEANVDIGCGNAFGGKNEEDEAEEEGALPEGAVKKLDILVAFNYGETSYEAKDYSVYIKGYMKKMVDYLTVKKPDRVAEFKKDATNIVKFILGQFKEFTFYTPTDNYNQDGIIILSYYKGEDECPTFIFFADGLEEVKL